MVLKVHGVFYEKMNPAGNVGNGCASPQLGMQIKGGESEEHRETLSNNALPHLCNNWIQNSKLNYFQWGLFLDIALGVPVGFAPDVRAQDYLYIFTRLLGTIRLYFWLLQAWLINTDGEAERL